MEKPKIAIVGPTYPYRGGIAQYTDALIKSMDKISEIYPISFKKLYPKSLYPGESDKVAPLEEESRDNVDYILEAASLRSWDKTVNKIATKKCDVVIITWWTFFWQPALGYIAWRLKRKGIKVIYLCHNIVDHEENWLKRQISKRMIKVADGHIVHSYEEVAKLKKLYPKANIMRRPHPIYTHFPKPKNKLKKRGKLELLYFGIVRPYKGVDVLARAMKSLNDKEVYLTIAGEVWGKEYKNSLNKLIKSVKNANIEYHFKYIDEAKAADYFARADVIVLPYISATGSGVITLAYNYGKPVIASAVGGLADAVKDGDTGWLISPKAPAELAKTIKSIDREQAKSMSKHIEKYCKENSWDNMAKEIKVFSSKLEV